MLKLQQVRQFAVAAEQGSFKAAAASTFRSQAAVSIAMRELERTVEASRGVIQSPDATISGDLGVSAFVRVEQFPALERAEPQDEGYAGEGEQRGQTAARPRGRGRIRLHPIGRLIGGRSAFLRHDTANGRESA